MLRTLLLSFGMWLVRVCSLAPAPPAPIEVWAAVAQACKDAGLNAALLTGSTDLVATGKLYPILHHAAVALGKDHELRTIDDVVDWLVQAPQAVL